jgi:hypothetical protein
MAIAARTAPAAATKGNGGTINVPTPSGFVSGDLLVMALVQDGNTLETSPSGWTQRGRMTVAHSGGPLAAPRAVVYSRIANGGEGSSVAVTYSTSSWPSGNANIIGFMMAYSGANTASPGEGFATNSFSPPAAAAQALPQVTTAVANDWLVSIRFGSTSAGGTTSTNSVGTDAERVDAVFSELNLVYYDSNTPLAAGLQTQRTITSSAVNDMGSAVFTMAIKPATGAGATTAFPSTAAATGTAYAPAAATAASPWSNVCGTGSAPFYTWAVDWAQSGMTAAGAILDTNGYLDTGDLTGWAASNSTVAYSPESVRIGQRGLRTFTVVPNGSSASGGVNANILAKGIIPGNSYIADCWVYSDQGWSDVRTAVDWSTSGGAFISSGLGSATVLAPGVWTHLRQTFIAPATAAQASMRFRWGSTPPSSVVFNVWGLLLMDPTMPEDRMTPDATAVVQRDITQAGLTVAWGRDQFRPLSPAALGTGNAVLDNSTRVYSPEFSPSPLFGNEDAARPVRGQVVFDGVTYSLFSGYLNDYTVTVGLADRSVALSFQDGLSKAQKTGLYTALYRSIRTGDAVNIILDAIHWPGPRDIDPGATVMPYWWLENTLVPTALDDLVRSEGTPAIAYAAPDGTFVFRDRHHRLLREQSLTVQEAYAAQELGVCNAPAVTGLSFSEPFTYAHGWRDIVNNVSFSVGQRVASVDAAQVWLSTNPYTVQDGQTLLVRATASDPFTNPIVPVVGTDFTVTSGGSVSVALLSVNGQSATIALTASGADTTVSGLQLRATPVPAVTTVIVGAQDSASITQHGQQDYPDPAPWASAEDATAIASLIVARYAQRRPTVQLTVHSSDPLHFVAVAGTAISDLVSIEHDEMGLDSPFYVEHLAHTVNRMNPLGQAPVHSVVLGCEQQGQNAANPFTFDQRGAGFDDGQFSYGGDSPDTVFVFDDPVQGRFDYGLLGT